MTTDHVTPSKPIPPGYKRQVEPGDIRQVFF